MKSLSNERNLNKKEEVKHDLVSPDNNLEWTLGNENYLDLHILEQTLDDKKKWI